MKKNKIDKKVQGLIDKASRESQKNRIREWNSVCEMLIQNDSELTVSNCVRHMINRGQKISAQTVYNKDWNPYSQIFEAWGKYRLSKGKSPAANLAMNSEDIYVDDADLEKITDPVIKYRVSLLVGQTKSYKKQLDMMRDVRQMQTIYIVDGPYGARLEDSSSIVLTEFEVQVLSELLSSSAVEFNDDGKMLTKRNMRAGTGLTSEGFQQAIEKILHSYKVI